MKLPNLDLLIPAPLTPVVANRWATVTSTSPLAVRIDGEADPLPVVPIDLVGGLAVNQRVRCAFDGGQVYVVGRLGGRDLSGYATTSALSSGLSGKANTTHSHAAADITSGTFSQDRIPVLAAAKMTYESFSGAGQISLASGWTYSNLQIRRYGRICQLQGRFTYNSTIAAGNHTNITVGTLTDSSLYPVLPAPTSPYQWDNGEGGVLTTAGGLVACYNLGSTISSGSNIDFGCTYICTL